MNTQLTLKEMDLQCLEEKRVILTEYYKTIFNSNITAMANMARKYTDYVGNNDFINNCTESQADTFLKRYEKSYYNCMAIYYNQ